MPSINALAETAALVGDPARAAMLAALMDGRARTAGELAASAGITPQTASGHLARLAGAGLLAMEKQGRHRYHRLASAGVARMLEGIMAVAEGGAPPARAARPFGPRDAAMRAARTCYDHLAGRLAVALADAMVARGVLELGPDGGAVTPSGEAFLEAFGIPMARPARGRLFCRPCLDWSERRPHVAGVLGAALCTRCLDLGWVRRREGGRTLLVTPEGARGFRDAFGVEVAATP
ncbi:helix-turn-helix transcriptional regulator [Roseomonas stagni]|uniref:Helix-turn-helix transcriptional regulator n=1 Tax=Falsiroseomonas algicola TaxID=2716930 RepID=A0A6M1LJQ7_9PROT|nr:helix-turn-helix domain-containing protein [Falsiroseomonas algicola]NGM20575.1 helix-turn-helix transcriptional regulator [Falsiroseomonas algicola]